MSILSIVLVIAELVVIVVGSDYAIRRNSALALFGTGALSLIIVFLWIQLLLNAR